MPGQFRALSMRLENLSTYGAELGLRDRLGIFISKSGLPTQDETVQPVRCLVLVAWLHVSSVFRWRTNEARLVLHKTCSLRPSHCSRRLEMPQSHWLDASKPPATHRKARALQPDCPPRWAARLGQKPLRYASVITASNETREQAKQSEADIAPHAEKLKRRTVAQRIPAPPRLLVTHTEPSECAILILVVKRSFRVEILGLRTNHSCG